MEDRTPRSSGETVERRGEEEGRQWRKRRHRKKKPKLEHTDNERR